MGKPEQIAKKSHRGESESPEAESSEKKVKFERGNLLKTLRKYAKICEHNIKVKEIIKHKTHKKDYYTDAIRELKEHKNNIKDWSPAECLATYIYIVSMYTDKASYEYNFEKLPAQQFGAFKDFYDEVIEKIPADQQKGPNKDPLYRIFNRVTKLHRSEQFNDYDAYNEIIKDVENAEGKLPDELEAKREQRIEKENKKLREMFYTIIKKIEKMGEFNDETINEIIKESMNEYKQYGSRGFTIARSYLNRFIDSGASYNEKVEKYDSKEEHTELEKKVIDYLNKFMDLYNQKHHKEYLKNKLKKSIEESFGSIKGLSLENAEHAYKATEELITTIYELEEETREDDKLTEEAKDSFEKDLSVLKQFLREIILNFLDNLEKYFRREINISSVVTLDSGKFNFNSKFNVNSKFNGHTLEIIGIDSSNILYLEEAFRPLFECLNAMYQEARTNVGEIRSISFSNHQEYLKNKLKPSIEESFGSIKGLSIENVKRAYDATDKLINTIFKLVDETREEDQLTEEEKDSFKKDLFVLIKFLQNIILNFLVKLEKYFGQEINISSVVTLDSGKFNFNSKFNVNSKIDGHTLEIIGIDSSNILYLEEAFRPLFDCLNVMYQEARTNESEIRSISLSNHKEYLRNKLKKSIEEGCFKSIKELSLENARHAHGSTGVLIKKIDLLAKETEGDKKLTREQKDIFKDEFGVLKTFLEEIILNFLDKLEKYFYEEIDIKKVVELESGKFDFNSKFNGGTSGSTEIDSSNILYLEDAFKPLFDCFNVMYQEACREKTISVDDPDGKHTLKNFKLGKWNLKNWLKDDSSSDIIILYPAKCRPEWDGKTHAIKCYKTGKYYIYDIGEKLGNDYDSLNRNYKDKKDEHPFFLAVEKVFEVSTDVVCDWSKTSGFWNTALYWRSQLSGTPFFKLERKWHEKLKGEGLTMNEIKFNPITRESPYFELFPKSELRSNDERKIKYVKYVCHKKYTKIR